MPGDGAQTLVLIVEDDEELGALLADIVQGMGYAVRTVKTGARGLQEARDTHPALVLLDLRLPDIAGMSVCREILALRGPRVIVITGLDDADTAKTALEMGADDYVRKPFHLGELTARIRAVLRRHSGDTESILRAGRITIDRDRALARVDDREVTLSATEFKLLEFLAEHPGWVFSKERLLLALWPEDRDPHAVQVHVHNLRRKIEPDPANPVFLVTVKGLGYRLEPMGRPQTDGD